MHIEYITAHFVSARDSVLNQGSWGKLVWRLYIEQLYVLYLFLFPPVASAPPTPTAVQEGPTGIRVSWIPSTPLGETAGYRIYYGGGSSGSVDVSGDSTDNYLVDSLKNGATYTICIVGTSKHFFSEEVKNPNSITLSELLILCQYMEYML